MPKREKKQKGKKDLKILKTLKNIFSQYGDGVFDSLGTIIKGIAFVVAFVIIILFIAIAYLMLSSDMHFIGLALGIILIGIIIAAIVMFLIFGLGHTICQNDEILKLLKNSEEE